MGAGNYFLNSPAVPSHKQSEGLWDKMLYVDIWDEHSLEDEQEGATLDEIQEALSALECDISHPQRVGLEQIGDANVIAEIGHMVIACAYTYYCDRLALIVAPNRDLSDLIYAVENDGDKEFETYRGCSPWLIKQARIRNLQKANLIRSIQSGAIHREMTACFEKVLFALHDFGLANLISFRAGAWCSTSYKNTALYKQNALRAKRYSNAASQINLAIQGVSHV